MEPTSDIFDADLVFCPLKEYDAYHQAASRRNMKKQFISIIEVQDGASVYTPVEIMQRPEVLRVLKTTAWHTRGGSCRSSDRFPRGTHRGAHLLDLLGTGQETLPPGILNTSAADRIVEKGGFCS